MITITRDDAIRLLEKQVDEKGAEHTAIAATKFNGEPQCIVACVFDALGFDVDLLGGMVDTYVIQINESFSPFRERFSFDEGALQVLRVAQQKQDKGASWGEAVAHAKEAGMNTEEFAAYIDAGIKHAPVEAKIIKRIYKALGKAGKPVTSVWDGEEEHKVSTLREVYEQAFNLDQLWLYTDNGAWVFVVMGEEWDTLSDYTVSLEEALKPVNDWIMEHY